MRADVHGGPEHTTLQSEAGYIDARPPADKSTKLLATHGRTIHGGQVAKNGRSLRHVRLAADCGSAEEPFYGLRRCDTSPTDRERSVTKLTHPNKPRVSPRVASAPDRAGSPSWHTSSACRRVDPRLRLRPRSHSACHGEEHLTGTCLTRAELHPISAPANVCDVQKFGTSAPMQSKVSGRSRALRPPLDRHDRSPLRSASTAPEPPLQAEHLRAAAQPNF
jgi:hypothetical protein